MESYLTKSEINLINVALERKFKHLEKRERDFGYDFSSKLNCLLNRDYYITKAFVLESLHHVPGMDYPHEDDQYVFEKDFNSYVEFVLKQANHIPWNESLSKTRRTRSRVEPFELFKRMLSLDDYKHRMSPLLKKVLQKIVPHKRVTWVISLLLDFHYGYECSLVLSPVFKLFFKVFQFFPYSFYVGHMYCNRPFSYGSFFLSRYLKIIQRNGCLNHFITPAMDIFYFHSRVKNTFFKHVPDLEYVLENMPNMPLKSDLLNCLERGRLKSLDLCLPLSLLNFVMLHTFGASSNYSSEDWDFMKYRGMHEIDYYIINNGATVTALERFSLRLNQVVRLFEESELNERSRREAEYVLKLLWASIPDPFVTPEEVRDYLKEPLNYWELCPPRIKGVNLPSYFLRKKSAEEHPVSEFFHKTVPMASEYTAHYVQKLPHGLAGTPAAAVIMQAWQWYKDVLLPGNRLVKSPRKLLHLSRVAIRQSLVLNFQLPKGVQLLNLPKSMTNYLLMKDCGTNPFEEEHYLKEKLWRLRVTEV